jgi:ADP-ribose pyrophosphatase YjhB (NUDIX family)
MSDVARIDYLDDPAASKANSIVPAVSVVIPDDEDHILLIHRTDNKYWSIPGGGMEPGESVHEAAKREVKEETGIDCEVTALVGVYSNPRHVAAYDDGEVRQEFSICLVGRLISGSLQTSTESSEVRFVPTADISTYEIHPSIRMRISRYLENRAAPYIS